MSTPRPLPSEILCTPQFGSGSLYVFPRRELGSMRKFGWGLIAIGLLTWAFMTFWAVGFVGGFGRILGAWGYLSILLAIPGFLAGAAMIGIALAGMYGHAEIATDDVYIRCSERLGPFSWTRKVRRDGIERLLVHGAGDALKGDRSRSSFGPFEGLAALKAESRSGKPRWLATAYPREWLLAVADQLAMEVAGANTGDVAEPLPVVSVVDVPSAPPGEMDRHELPTDSLIEQRQVPGGFSLILPARGVWKGSAGLFGFSLLWCGFMTLFTIGIIGAMVFGAEPPDENAWWLFPMVITLFWAIGIGMLVAAMDMGKREAAIAAVDGRIKLIQTSLFGVAREDWDAAEILTVRKGPSGVEVNDVPVMQLQFVLQNGKTRGFFTGRDEPELEWIATQLRMAIRETPVETR